MATAIVDINSTEGVMAPFHTEDPSVDPNAAPAGTDPGSRGPDATLPVPASSDTAPSGADAEPPDTAPDTKPDDTASQPQELDDETLEAVSDAYLERLLQTKGLKSALEKRVRAEVDQRTQQQQQQRETEDTIQRLTVQARGAVDSILGVTQGIQRAVNAARQGYVRDPDVAETQVDLSFADGNRLVANLQLYGQAIAGELDYRYDQAIRNGFNELFGDTLPELESDEQAEALDKIINNAERKKYDPKQATDAPAYLVRELMKFAAERGLERGRALERQHIDQRSSLADKVTNANAIAVARAKLGKEPLPPAPIPGAPISDSSFEATWEDRYDQLMKAGQHEQAQEIVNEASRRRLGGRR